MASPRAGQRDAIAINTSKTGKLTAAGDAMKIRRAEFLNVIHQEMIAKVLKNMDVELVAKVIGVRKALPAKLTARLTIPASIFIRAWFRDRLALGRQELLKNSLAR